MDGPRAELALAVDRIRCDGYGMCAGLVPELIDLDDWGYPMVRPGGVPAEVLEHARRAVAVCPVLALALRPLAPATGATAGAPEWKPATNATGASRWPRASGL